MHRRLRAGRRRPRRRVGDRAPRAPWTTPCAGRPPCSAGRHQPPPTRSTRLRSGTASPSTPSTASARTRRRAAAGRRAPPSRRSTPTDGLDRRGRRPGHRDVQRGRRGPGLGVHPLVQRRPGRVRPSPAARRPSPSTRRPTCRSATRARRPSRVASVSDIDTNDPPDTMAADRTCDLLHRSGRRPLRAARDHHRLAIQGSGDERRPLGRHADRPWRRRRRPRGPVARAARLLRPGPTGDGDAATSDAIFVFNGGNQDLVDLGDVVTVTGTVGENQGQTQISSTAVNIAVCGTGTVAPTDGRPCRWPSATDFEKLRGHARAHARRRSTVTEHFQLGRFGQVLALVRRSPRRSRPTSSRPAPRPSPSRRRTTSTRSSSTTPRRPRTPTRSSSAGAASRSAPTNTLRGGDTITGADRRHDLHLGWQRGQPERLPGAPGQRARRCVRLRARQPAARRP